MSKTNKLNLNDLKNFSVGEDNFGGENNAEFGINQDEAIGRAFPKLEEEGKTEESAFGGNKSNNKLDEEISERENVARNDYGEFGGIPLGDASDITNIAMGAFNPEPVNNMFRDMVLDENVSSFVYKVPLDSVISYVERIVTVKNAKVNTLDTTPADFVRRMNGVLFGDTLKYFFPSANSMAKRGVFYHSLLAVECNIDDIANDSSGRNEKYSNFLEEAMAQNPDAVYNINNADIIFGIQVPKCIMTDYRTGRLIFFVNTLSVILGSLNVNMSLIKNMNITVAETSDRMLHIFVNKKQ